MKFRKFELATHDGEKLLWANKEKNFYRDWVKNFSDSLANIYEKSILDLEQNKFAEIVASLNELEVIFYEIDELLGSIFSNKKIKKLCPFKKILKLFYFKNLIVELLNLLCEEISDINNTKNQGDAFNRNRPAYISRLSRLVEEEGEDLYINELIMRKRFKKWGSKTGIFPKKSKK